METTNTTDHDLLIELRTEMRGVRTDIRDLSDNTSKRVDGLENSKFDTAEALRWKLELDVKYEDHEKRLRTLETATTDLVSSIKATTKMWGVIATVLTLLLTAFGLALNFL